MEMRASPARTPADEEGEKRRAHEHRNTLITAAASILGTLIATAGAVFGAVWAAPDRVGQITRDALGDHAAITRTATAVTTATLTVTATPGGTVPSPSPDGTPQAVIKVVRALDAVANDGCWLDDSVSLAGSDRRYQALTCRLNRSDAFTSQLDYVVPQDATRFTATVGSDRQSSNSSARVEFSVTDLDGRVLDTKTATYSTPAQIDAKVSGVPRIRLRIALISSDDKISPGNLATVAWVVPAFSR